MGFPTNAPQLREGSSDSFKNGSLIRRLKPIRLANFKTGLVGSTAAQAFRVTILGLTSNLTCHVGVGIVRDDGNPYLPSNYPAVTPGTMQITPVVKNPELGKLYLREVFQDPVLSAVDNANHPLPQNIPFGWSFVSEGADEVRVDVAILAGIYALEAFTGVLACVATIEYTGDWQDIKTVERAIADVRMVGDEDVIQMQTAGG